jgi:FkbM family methyltransferase
MFIQKGKMSTSAWKTTFCASRRGFRKVVSDIKTLLKNALALLTANSRCQRLLERLVIAEQWLMGIGSGGVPESSGERILVKLLQEKSARVGRTLTIFDVGANSGQFSSLLLRGLGGTPFRIHAFEPSAVTFQALTQTHGGDARLTLNNLGLGEEKGAMTLYSDADASGLASLYPRQLAHFGVSLARTEMVAIDTLEAYCDREEIDRIDLLKLDVEGHELDVLRGADGLIRAARIDMITFEFGGCNIDSRSFLQDFFYFFKERGAFDLYRITPSGYLAPVSQYSEVYEQFRTTNFLAFRRE